MVSTEKPKCENPGIVRTEYAFHLIQQCGCLEGDCPNRQKAAEFKERIERGAKELAKKLGVEVV